MSDREQYEIKRLRAEVRELRAQVATQAVQHDAATVTIPVMVPVEIYARLCSRAGGTGQPAEALASLWMWRAVREF